MVINSELILDAVITISDRVENRLPFNLATANTTGFTSPVRPQFILENLDPRMLFIVC
jgi:hypothetical protein